MFFIWTNSRLPDRYGRGIDRMEVGARQVLTALVKRKQVCHIENYIKNSRNTESFSEIDECAVGIASNRYKFNL